MSPKILVTGATGFLGRHVLDCLLSQQNTHPICLVRDPQSFDRWAWSKKIKNNLTVLAGGLADTSWHDHNTTQNLDGILHLAAKVEHARHQASELYQTNVVATLRMVELAAKHQCRLVFVSTSGTVGCFKTLSESADENAPYCEQIIKNWPYYHSKLEAEKKARQRAKELGVELVIIRPPVMLGPGDHRLRSTSHIIKMLKRKLPFLLKGGIQFIDVRDAALAMIAALHKQNPKEIYHLSGWSGSIDDFFKKIETISKVKAPSWHLPYPLALSLAHAAKFLSQILRQEKSFLPDPVVIEMASHYWTTHSLYAKDDLNFVARDADETLQDTVQWLYEELNFS